jgi:hypothetical protein
METVHTETVAEKAVAYVKDMFGIPPGDRNPDVEAKPEYADTAPELASDDAMRLDPQAYTFNTIVERSRRADGEYEAGQANIAADEHTQAAGQLDRARGLVGQALSEIDDVSRGMKDTMHDGKKLPSESEMQEAVERAKATDGTRSH